MQNDFLHYFNQSITNKILYELIIMNRHNLTAIITIFILIVGMGAASGQGLRSTKTNRKTPGSKLSPGMNGPLKSSDFVEKMDKGQINWTNQYIEAEGNSVFDTTRFKIKNQAKLMAQRGAMVDAQRNLLEIVNGVLVEGQTTVKDLVVESDEVKTKVSGMLKGAMQVGKTKFEDGIATIRLRIPLYADGLAEAVDTMPFQPIPKATETSADSLPANVVLSVSGGYKPRLFPKLTDDQNNIILDMANAFDPSNGKAPTIVKQSLQSLTALKGKKGVELLEAVQDQLGNLVLSEKSRARVEKWKKAGLLVWGLVKKLILPI